MIVEGKIGSKNKKDPTQGGQFLLSQEFYQRYLQLIGGIHFTCRETDILAFFMHGRTAKKVASFLDIKPGTVEYHASKIMQKVNCNSREHVIDFLEKSPQKALLGKHYEHLCTEAFFEETLKKIPQSAKFIPPTSLLIGFNSEKTRLQLLRIHLALCNIKTTVQVLPFSEKECFQKTSAKDTEEGLEEALEKALEQTFAHLPQKHYEQIIFLSPCDFPLSQLQSILAKTYQGHPLILVCPEGQEKDERSGAACKVRRSISAGFLMESLSNSPVTIPCVPLPDPRNLEQYCGSFFALLRALLPSFCFQEVQKHFDKHSFSTIEDVSSRQGTSPEAPKIQAAPFYSLPFIMLSFLVFLLCASLSFWIFYPPAATTIHSEMFIPPKKHFLERPALTAQLQNCLRDQSEIRVVAIVGIGGTGKTTLARHFSKQQSPQLSWEINAETALSLRNSFEKMARSLCKTEKDLKILRELQEIKKSEEKEEKILAFVKEKLKAFSPWILLYDNVEDMILTQKYLPQDSNEWGNGSVLITSRNDNIRENPYVNQVVGIGELNQSDKFTLFTKVMYSPYPHQYSREEGKDLADFLENIPSFPLDVSVAAHYLKVMSIPYKQYLERLSQCGEDFSVVQKNIAQGDGHYEKTRYSIVTSSLKALISWGSDFKDLMIFITLLDSQRIPREILELYKTISTVDNFIHKLKQFSLVTTELTPGGKEKDALTPTLSLHRSTQEISLSYLKAGFSKDSPVLCSIIKLLTRSLYNAREQDNFSKMKKLERHCTRLLQHEFFQDVDVATLKAELGGVYIHLGVVSKAQQLLEESIALLEPVASQNWSILAQSHAYLGCAYRISGDFKKAKIFFEKALSICGQHPLIPHPKFAWILMGLGKSYGSLGQYEKAQNLLEEALTLYEKEPAPNDAKISSILMHLGGSIYRRLGNYEKAQDAAEKALALSDKLFPKDHPNRALALVQLGRIYGDLEKHEEAKTVTEEGLKIFREEKNHQKVAVSLTWLAKYYLHMQMVSDARTCIEETYEILATHLPQNHIKKVEADIEMSKIYQDLKEYGKAQELLEKTLPLLKAHYGEEHSTIAQVLNALGKNHLLRGDIDSAEPLLLKALAILRKDKNSEQYLSLELLGEVYKQRKDPGGNRASNTLKEALQSATAYFPKDCPLVQRLKRKQKDFV